MKTCSVAVNGRAFKAKAGDVLLDAALANGVGIPHDCRSGICGSCLARIVKGSTILGNAPTPSMVYACKARILSDLEIEIEDMPKAVLLNGRVRVLRSLAPDVFEVTIDPERRLRYLPGQYFKFKFAGFPARSYSATRPLESRSSSLGITLQVRRYSNGRVSGQLGQRIKPGHPVEIAGPHGSAFLRPGKTNRLILISSGTGFAPIWSIACAALRENIERAIVVVAGVRTESPIYMAPALERLAKFPNVDVAVTIGRRPSIAPHVSEGYPTDCLPRLNGDDTVYACGPANMIETLSPVALASGAQLYSDPFEPASDAAGGPLLETAQNLLERYLRPKAGSAPALPNTLLGARVGA